MTIKRQLNLRHVPDRRAYHKLSGLIEEFLKKDKSWIYIE
jgi:hypothetical protein